MNTLFRTIGVFVLTSVLFVSLGMGSRPSPEPPLLDGSANDEGKAYSASTKLPCQFIDFDDSLQGLESLPESYHQVPPGFTALHKFIETYLAAEYRSYKIYSHNLLTRFRKCDIIFPFHYFW
ncbi:hypothetical protein [Pseudozobellia thermophila]|nr:hypothetical protein [Pseudozobellia thermophila]